MPKNLLDSYFTEVNYVFEDDLFYILRGLEAGRDKKVKQRNLFKERYRTMMDYEQLDYFTYYPTKILTCSMGRELVAIAGPVSSPAGSVDLEMWQYVHDRSGGGDNFIQIGSTLNIPNFTLVDKQGLVGLNETDMAILNINGSPDIVGLSLYRFNGSTWSKIGTTLDIDSGSAKGGNYGMTAIGDFEIVLVDSTQEILDTYRWNNTSETWSQVYNELPLTGIGNPSLTTMYKNSNDETINIACLDEDIHNLKMIRFDGINTWVEITPSLDVGSSIVKPTISAINATDIIMDDDGDEYVRMFRFDYRTDLWTEYRPSYKSITNPTQRMLIVMDGFNVFLTDITNRTIYMLGALYDLHLPHSPVNNLDWI